MADSQLVTRAGFDVNHGIAAMAIRNETNERNAIEAAEGGGGRRRGAQMGKLYSWGSGDYGRLGHGDNQPKKSAKLVEILRDKNIIKFVCGPRHTLALASDGSVYTWGYGGDGQLGHGDFQLQTMPTQIKALLGEHVIDMSCGDKHSAVLTSGGDVFTWGDGSLGQLGLGDFRRQHTPHRVMELQGKMILQISCGAYHTACIDKDEQVYTWGQGGSGRLGHEQENDLAVPTLVESLQGKGIQGVQCFHEHTMALTLPLSSAQSGLFDENSQERLLCAPCRARRAAVPHAAAAPAAPRAAAPVAPRALLRRTPRASLAPLPTAWACGMGLRGGARTANASRSSR